LRFANPSPPSGWIEDFHLQVVVHARHTARKPLRGAAFELSASYLVGGTGFELMHLNAVDALKDFPNDPSLDARATILLRIDWLSGFIRVLLW
jgi:hypothetical protein